MLTNKSKVKRVNCNLQMRHSLSYREEDEDDDKSIILPHLSALAVFVYGDDVAGGGIYV